MSTLVSESEFKDITVVLPEEDAEIRRRKPIGWNYQNVFPSKENDKVNGESEDESSITSIPEKSRSLSDDIEVLEVKEVKKRIQTKTVFPPSSTRKEIKDFIRGTIQAPISKYLNITVQKEKSYPSTSSESEKTNHNKILEENSQVITEEKTEEKEKSPHNLHEEKDENIANMNQEKKGTHDLMEEKSKEMSHDSDEKEICVENKENNVPSLSDEDKVISIESNKEVINKLSEVKDQSVVEKSLHNVSEEKDEFENKENINQDTEISPEYSNSVVQKFVEKWKSIKMFGKDDEKVKERLLRHYAVCHSSYTQSRKFINGLGKGTKYLTEGNLVKFISSIIENLKRFKDEPYVEKKKKLKNLSETEAKIEEEKELEKVETEPEVLSEADLKKNRKLKKIEKALITLSGKIKKLEEEDCDWEDEDNSSYLILHRLKQQFIKLDTLYCKIAECSSTTGRPLEKKFKFEGSRYPEINKRITAWVNKNRCFPDYMDILNLVKKVTKNNFLPLKPEVVRVEAVNIFRDVGKILKQRREKDDAFCIYAYADDSLEIDPADVDSQLGSKLEDNEKEAKKKLDDVFQFFVEKEATKAEEEKSVRDEQEQPKGKKKIKKEDGDECQSDEETESRSEGFYDTEFDDSEDVEENAANSEEVEGSSGDIEEVEESAVNSEEMEEGSSGDIEEVVESDPNSEEYFSECEEEASSALWGKRIENIFDKEITFDDSDDDIQEIRDTLTSHGLTSMTPYPLTVNDIPDEEISSQYENDVEIDESPVINLEIDEFRISKPSGSIKRKEPDGDSILSPKRRRHEPELVEIDPELVEID